MKNPLCRSDLYIQLVDLYLDRINNWLTIEKFSEHHGLPVEVMKSLLRIGEVLHENNLEDFAAAKKFKYKYFIDCAIASGYIQKYCIYSLQTYWLWVAPDGEEFTHDSAYDVCSFLGELDNIKETFE